MILPRKENDYDLNYLNLLEIYIANFNHEIFFIFIYDYYI